MTKKLFFTFVLASIASAATNPNIDGKKMETWIGKEENAVISVLTAAKNSKYKIDGAGLKDATASVVYNMSNPKKPIPMYVWVSPVSKSVSTITGVMKIPALKNGEAFALECGDVQNSATVGIIKVNKNSSVIPATKVWAVESSGKFHEVPAAGVKCINSTIN